MKPKIRLKSLFWTFLFIALVWGCERDYLTEFPDVSTAPTSSLEEARAWFSAGGLMGTYGCICKPGPVAAFFFIQSPVGIIIVKPKPPVILPSTWR